MYGSSLQRSHRGAASGSPSKDFGENNDEGEGDRRGKKEKSSRGGHGVHGVIDRYSACFAVFGEARLKTSIKRLINGKEVLRGLRARLYYC